MLHRPETAGSPTLPRCPCWFSRRVVAALAVGQTLIILTAGIDLSVGAITILSTMVMATLAAQNGWPAGLALAAGVVLGLAAGALNGILVTRIGLPPFYRHAPAP